MNTILINQNLFIMKKTLFIFVAMLLFIGTSFAQTMVLRSVEVNDLSSQSVSSTKLSRSVVYYEGFESTTSTALPTGWKTEQTSAVTPWITINSEDALPDVQNSVTAQSGDRSMARSWSASGVNAWAFTSGFELKAGVNYTVIFWFLAPGYPSFNEYDDFEVKIGQSQTSSGMTYTLFSNINERVRQWTKAQCLFQPTTSGIHYLGFHDLNKGAEGIYIYIDEIEVAECSCCPVTDLKIEYTSACVAELTWSSPSKSSNVYRVLRNGVEIATVETESYTDTDFETTIGHTWTVQVLCGDDDVSIETSVTKERCEAPDCDKLVRNLSVTYSEGCDEATVTWFPPAEILWDNTASPEMYVIKSTRWLMAPLGRAISADDFIIPAGEKWHITDVRTSGTHVINSGTFLPPDYFGVEIYKDDNGIPGELLHEDVYCKPMSGNMSDGGPVIVLSNTIELGSGKYWISCYGVYDNIYGDEFQYYITLCSAPNGSPLCTLEEAGSNMWEPEDGDMPSLYFRIQGHKVSETLKYNVYRDGQLIAPNLTELSYADTEFNPVAKHRWGIVVVCPSGNSAPVLSYKNECDEVGVIEPENNSFKLFPNPSSNTITIKAENNFNKVEVYNILGQPVLTQSVNGISNTTLNVAHLNAGIYFVRITTDTGIVVQKFVKK